MLNKFLKDRAGATAVEYALIIALMAAIVVAAVSTLKGGIDNAFSTVASQLNDPTSALGGSGG
jgi:pilus assembly protein Flp/PilA